MQFAEIIYVQKDNFVEKALPVFIGAILAFVFSITLFYLTETIKVNKNRKDLEDNLSREIQFNVSLLEKIKIELDRLTQSVSANDKTILPLFKFEKFQRNFLLEAFNRGLLYKKLSDDEINTADSMMTYFSFGTSEYLRVRVDGFKSDDVKPADMLNTLRYNIDETIKYTDFLRLIQTRFREK